MGRSRSGAGEIKADFVDFDGVRYYRYPDSPRHDRRCYYWSKSHKALHRAVWEKAHGRLPDGCVVHHKNGDTLDNSIENLECLSKSEHSMLHGLERGGSVVPAAACTLVCDICGAHFEGTTGLRRFYVCSERCRGIARKVVEHYFGDGGYVPQVQARKSTRYELRCERCGAVFTSVRHDARFCSKRCRDAYTWSRGLTTAQKRGYYTVTCTVCGKTFESRNKDARCCSRACVNYCRWHKDGV